jgi:hypothetical protein
MVSAKAGVIQLFSTISVRLGEPVGDQHGHLGLEPRGHRARRRDPAMAWGK